MRIDPLRRGTTWWLAALVACGLWPAAASAKPAAKQRVVVQPFSGPASARVREAVVQALKKSRRYELVPNDRAEDAARELNADLSDDAGRAAVANRLGAAGFVSGTIEKRGRQLVLTLQVQGGASGALTEERTYRGRQPGALVRQVKRRLAAELRRTPLKLEPPEQAEPDSEPQLQVSEAEPEPEPEPEPETEPEPEPTPAPADEDEALIADEAAIEEADADVGAEDALPALELALGVRIVTRSFAYDQPINLREHSVDPTPAGHAQLRWYPGAHFTQGFAAHLGIEAYGQLMLPVEATVGPAVHETTSTAFGVNLRGRIPLAPSELGLHVGYGAYDVDIGNSQFGGDPEVPSVAYRFVRVGADARIALGERFALSLVASYLMLMDFGELSDPAWFPDASGGGVQARLGAGLALVGPLWLEADFGITHFFLNMNVEPPATAMQRVAEGATDQQLFATLGLALRL